MSDLKCEYPDGCRLDLWAKVIKSRYIERQIKILDILFVVPEFGEGGIGGKIQAIDDIKIKVIDAYEDLNFNKIKIYIHYKVILFVIVNNEYKVIEVEEFYEQTIELDEFDPPLSVEEFRNDIEQSEIILKNWNYDCEIKGASEDPSNPCHLTTPVIGTCLHLAVYVDIIDKLGKMHDVIVYGELDPEIEC